MMAKMEMMEAAANLYDGGWRSEDRDEMKNLYWLTDDEADGLAKELKRIRDSKVVDSDGNEYDFTRKWRRVRIRSSSMRM